MKRFLLPLGFLLSIPCIALADDPYKDMLSTETPKCSWSTMKTPDYKYCKQTEEHFKKMSPEDRQKHDDEVKSHKKKGGGGDSEKKK